MSKENVEVNLEKLSGKVFVGRANGQAARKYFRLNKYSEKDNRILFLVPKDTISVNSSFFLGLFGEDVQRIGDFDKFFEYVDIRFVDDRFKDQLEVAVKRSLSKSSYGI